MKYLPHKHKDSLRQYRSPKLKRNLMKRPGHEVTSIEIFLYAGYDSPHMI